MPVVLYLYEQLAGRQAGTGGTGSPTSKLSIMSRAPGRCSMTAEDGNTFSLRCLATIAITISDNIAHNMLVRYLVPIMS